ncbi:hypothetical protein ACQP2F_13510 [Actinoplanes sp. CA-030573]|uniref:hypothetical protein n=1 Tax=Actinoplanes sp. CA-030573 TaxID=3239898 RepID=UPI003D92ACAC
MHPDEPDDHPSDIRPYLCIPYWTTPLTPGGKWDDGDRKALPPQVVSYACESIRTTAYQPGKPIEISVDVRNSGGGNGAAVATVVVYWADPSVGFTKPTFLTATGVAVPVTRTTPGLTTTAPPMKATIPATAPNHVCLLVCVSHPQDRAGLACDPIHDRHWAQRNLMAVPAAPGAPAIVPFAAGNPYAEERIYRLAFGPVDEWRQRQVAEASGIEPSDIRAQVRLLDEDGAAVSEPGERTEVRLRLGPLEQRRFQALFELPADLPPGRGAAVEAALDDGQDQGPAGSLGVVLVPPE